MSGRYLTDLAAVVRGAGLQCIEVDGWQTRARSSGGYASGRPTHVMVHHTASGPSSDGWPDVNYMTYSSENRPVANLYLNRGGTVWVMAAGATNTNGKGGPIDNVPLDSMNTYAVGIEAGNNGTGEPWPTTQQDAYVVLASALMTAYNLGHCRSHAEYAPGRKIDPAGPSRWAPVGGTWPMAAFRAELGGATIQTLSEGRSMFFLFRIIEHADPRPTYLTDGASYWQVSGSSVVSTVNAMQTAMGYPDTATPVHLLALAAWQQWKATCREGTTPVDRQPMR